MKFSKYQVAFFNAIKDTNEPIIMSAVAGSGKSTTITEGAKLIDQNKSILFLSFNKSIAEELAGKVPSNAIVKTFNGLGAGAIYLQLGRVTLNSNKTRTIMRDILDEEECRNFSDKITQLVSLAKAYCISPEGYFGTNDSDSAFNWLIRRFSIDVEFDEVDRFIDLARKVLLASVEQTKIIDFDDQLYLPVVLNMSMKKFDVIFVDESQDVSPVQRIMLKKSLTKSGRLIAVGDESQAIYSFRGGDSTSMAKIKSDFNCVEMPLSISYRCGKNIVAYAQQYVNHIQPFENAVDGNVMCWSHYKSSDFNSDDLMMCRNTAPLISMAFGLLARRVPVKVLGREIGTNLIRLIDRLNPNGIYGENGLTGKLERWKDQEYSKFMESGKESQAEGVNDKYNSLIAFLDNCSASSVDKLKSEIEKLFSAKKGCMTLCTIHKAKGLEANRAFILNPELMPSSWAKQEWERVQETNLIYVAVTRAKKDLIFIRSIDKTTELSKG